MLRIVAKHKHSCVILRCKYHTVVSTRSTVYRDPKAAQGTSETDYGVADGVAAQKPPQQPLAGETSLLGGDPESNHGCPGPRDTKRDVKPTLSISNRAKVQCHPRSSPRWGNGRSRAQRYSPRWGNGRSRAHWEKNLTCLASLSAWSIDDL